VNDFNLDPSNWKDDASGLANRIANINSFMVLGAALGALLAIGVNDYAGRLRSWQLSVVIYVTGSLVQIFSSGLYALLLTARIWAGVGAGALTVTAPLYLSEIAPTKTRGLVISIYMVVLLFTLASGTR
jgi:MFS family permease